ncbi:AraC family transcriptional regulator [Pontibacter sp. G13]|uniref:helix-turn-helix domain-containing protein n=1 Tax=Pontibacter sp. G13 TaxID=3074898 RepID=UPI0028890F0D|nr:AraC family transcriptional regulator [Pontibacter sp. G13]WNJ17924.1 AraC family transcriptional regulator [Pontibacter sp. G13]
MTTKRADIAFFEWSEIGKRLPFGIVPWSELRKSQDLFVASLRDFHVIFWFKQGSGTYFVDFQEYQFRPNTLALLPKDQIHHFLPLDPENCEIQSIVFQPDFVYRHQNDLQHLFQFTVASHIEGQQILELRPEEAAHLGLLSDQMTEVYNNWSGEDQAYAFYHWLSLFLLACKRTHAAQFEQEEMDERTQRLLRFNELLEQHFRQTTKVEFYLEEMGINVKALSKLTKERYKLSPKAVIDQRRILELKRQLQGTTLPIKEIAYDLGFDEPTNMVKYFKKHTGMTPSAFRTES